MCLPPSAFFAAIQQVAHQVLVEAVLARKLRNGDAGSVELFACLIQCEGGGHSVHLCSIVFMYG